MIRIAIFSALFCAVLGRSLKYRPDGTCGVQNVFLECPGTICIERLFDEDGCMECTCHPKQKRLGDMVLSSELISFVLDGNREGTAKGADPSSKLWNTLKEGDRFVIPYAFSSDLTPPFIDAINAAMAELQQKCCFTFRKKTNETDFMFFFKGSGCFAPVGRWDGENRISIGDGCEYKGIVVHEIMHNLGFWHEHQRPDRDNHVKVITSNIQQASQDQYQIVQSINSMGSPYDYGSVMHYGANAFAIDNSKPTMTFANGSALSGLQDRELSASDAEQVLKLYNCSAPAANTTVAVTQTTTSPTTATTAATTTTNVTASTNTTTQISNTTASAAPTTTKSSIPNPPCVDGDANCSLWAAKGFCSDSRYVDTLQTVCPLSCKICSTASPCFDKSGSKRCSEWKDYCATSLAVKTECKMTCGLC